MFLKPTGDFNMAVFWYDFARYASMVLVGVLVFFECCQILGDIVKKRISRYFTSVPNIVDIISLSTAIAFLICHAENTQTGCCLFGWAIFFGYVNLTFILTFFRHFALTTYMCLEMTRSIFVTLVIFIPSFLAFGFAFHSFLFGSDTFNSNTESFLKTVVMFLGEFDLSNEFMPDMVDKVGGQQIHTQVSRFLSLIQNFLFNYLSIRSCFFFLQYMEALSLLMY